MVKKLPVLFFLLSSGLCATVSASTLNGTCKVTGVSFSPPNNPCEVVFSFTSLEMSYSQCLSYLAQFDGETCRAVAPYTGCNYTAGQVINAYCSGGPDFATDDNPFDFRKINFAGYEKGLPFYTRHYSDSFASWEEEARERWRSYLYRNAIARETGIAVWPDNPCLLYTSPSPRDLSTPRMPSSA